MPGEMWMLPTACWILWASLAAQLLYPFLPSFQPNESWEERIHKAYRNDFDFPTKPCLLESVSRIQILHIASFSLERLARPSTTETHTCHWMSKKKGMIYHITSWVFTTLCYSFHPRFASALGHMTGSWENVEGKKNNFLLVPVWGTVHFPLSSHPEKCAQLLPLPCFEQRGTSRPGGVSLTWPWSNS